MGFFGCDGFYENKCCFVVFFLCLISQASLSDSNANEKEKSIGVANMLLDRTIILQLRAEGDGDIVGDSYFEYLPSDPDYEMIKNHVGGLLPGEEKLVPPWGE